LALDFLATGVTTADLAVAGGGGTPGVRAGAGLHGLLATPVLAAGGVVVRAAGGALARAFGGAAVRAAGGAAVRAAGGAVVSAFAALPLVGIAGVAGLDVFGVDPPAD